jgi:hypothetical protein
VLLTLFVIIITFKIVKILVQTIQTSINITNRDVILSNNTKVLLDSDLSYNNIAVPSNELYLISHKFYNLFGMLFMETAFILLLALIAVIILTKTIVKSNS